MSGNKLIAVLWASFVVLTTTGCGGNDDTSEAQTSAKKEKVEHVVFGEFINPQDSLPRIRYFDGGLESANDRCAVRKVKLNPKMPPVYVNGRPIGFC